MALTNDTMSFFPVHWLATHDRQRACIVDVRVWLIAHHFVTVIVDAHCLLISLALSSSYMFAVLVSPAVRRFDLAFCPTFSLRSHGNRRSFSYVLAFLMKDISFVLLYVSAASLCEWLRSGGNADSIGLMKFQLWMVEATIFPGVLLCSAMGYLSGCLDLVLDEYQLLHPVLTVPKLPVFFWMRYAESRPYLRQHHFEVHYVTRICEKFIVGRPSL